MSHRLQEIESLFNNFNSDTLHLADDFYDRNVVFQDPIVELRGRDALKAYYADMYESVTSIRFDFSGGIEKDEEAVVFWKMEVRARGLKGGEPVLLEGVSHIRFGGEQGKAIALVLRVTLAKTDLTIPTITDIVPGAIFSERETQEMMGVIVEGIPDDRRLFIPEDFPDGVYPWRRDDTGPDKMLHVLPGRQGIQHE